MKRLFTSTFFALSALLLVASGQASAAQTGTLLPTSDGNYLQWTPKTGSSHFAMVDETTCNGQTNYNYTTILSQRDSYGIALSSIPDGSTITQIDITPCASKTGTGGTSTFNVFYRLNGVDSADAGNYAVPNSATPSVLSTTSFTGLSTVKSPSTIFEIGGVYSAGNKGVRLSQISTVVTYTPLTAPSGLTAVATPSGVTLNWTDNSSNEDGFKIERSDNGGAFNQIATVSANTTTYSDPISEGSYTYRVRAYNSGGNSGYTSNATAGFVNAPSGLVATASGSAISISWTDNSSVEDGFKVEIATNAGNFVQFKTVGANVTSTTASGSAGNTYSFRVRAYKSTINSDYSNTANATVLAAPTGLGTSVVGSNVTLNWNDNATGEDGYKIERSYNGGGFVEIGSVGANVTTFSDPGLASGSYDYRVRAYQSINTSDYSNTANALIP